MNRVKPECPSEQILAALGQTPCPDSFSESTAAMAQPINKIDLDRDTCKQFMRGEPIQKTESGWNAIQLNGRPLGWVKANGKIGKNHLTPRARMSGELTT